MTESQRLESDIIKKSNESKKGFAHWNNVHANFKQKQYEKEAKERGDSDFPQENKNIFKHNKELQIQEALWNQYKKQTKNKRKKQYFRTYLKTPRIDFKKQQKENIQQLIKDGYQHIHKKRNFKSYKTLDENRLKGICDFKFKDTRSRHRKLIAFKKGTLRYESHNKSSTI